MCTLFVSEIPVCTQVDESDSRCSFCRMRTTRGLYFYERRCARRSCGLATSELILDLGLLNWELTMSDMIAQRIYPSIWFWKNTPTAVRCMVLWHTAVISHHTYIHWYIDVWLIVGNAKTADVRGTRLHRGGSSSGSAAGKRSLPQSLPHRVPTPGNLRHFIFIFYF